eukprot:2015896-Amphidinium_carterae.1
MGPSGAHLASPEADCKRFELGQWRQGCLRGWAEVRMAPWPKRAWVGTVCGFSYAEQPTPLNVAEVKPSREEQSVKQHSQRLDSMHCSSQPCSWWSVGLIAEHINGKLEALLTGWSVATRGWDQAALAKSALQVIWAGHSPESLQSQCPKCLQMSASGVLASLHRWSA